MYIKTYTYIYTYTDGLVQDYSNSFVNTQNLPFL